MHTILCIYNGRQTLNEETLKSLRSGELDLLGGTILNGSLMSHVQNTIMVQHVL
jgi:hypothetical protein